MSARPLPESTPAAEGVDARGIDAFLDALEAAPDIEPHSVMIVRHGKLIASGWWAPYTPDRLHLLYSLSKSFTSTAAGFAVAEGLLDLDAPVVSYFPEFEAEITDPGSRAMLVRHVASMASGHLAETHDRAVALDPEEPVRGFLLLPPDRAPGSVFAYNQPATYSLAAIVQRVTGQTLTEYLRPRLFDPLGIGETVWEQYPAGRDLGFSGMYAATDAVAKLGLLHLREGVWEGRRLLSAEWVAEATRAHISNVNSAAGAAESDDWQQGYGFQFWRSRHGYRGDGAYGQFCLVLPEHDAVVAITASAQDMKAELDLVWEHLLRPSPPGHAAALGEGAEKRDAALRERTARLELPPLQGGPVPPGARDAWAGARFAPAGGRCEDQPDLTSVALTADGGDWLLELAAGPSPLRVPFSGSARGWTLGGGDDGEDGGGAAPVAVSGGWTDPDTLTVNVTFLETPHRLVVTCALAARTFTASHWPGVPLFDGSLSGLRAPRP